MGIKVNPKPRTRKQVDLFKTDIAASYTIEAMHDVLIKALRFGTLINQSLHEP